MKTESDDSLCLGLGEGMVAFLFLEIDGTLGTNVGGKVLVQAVRRAIRGRCEGSTLLYLEYEHHEGQWRVLYQ
jgi:hypothetical protein